MKEGANPGDKTRIKRVAAAFLCIFAALIVALPIIGYHHHSGALPEAITADQIIVEKSARKLSLFRKGAVWREYKIALGRVPIGAKQEEGDMKTPEGRYLIDYRNPHSDFHLALHISYPSPDEQARAAARGVSPGGDIMIHGVPNGDRDIGGHHPQEDWTAGCIALTDAEIEELWRLVPDGTPIEIRP